jgi:alpha-D-xyloside xylohydrolase
MVEELNELGIRIMISPWTLVEEASENFAAMKERGLFTGSTDGQHDTVERWGLPGEPFHQYDPTNPAAAEFLWDAWKRNYFDLGIRTFWLDPCDEFHPIQDYPRVRLHIGSGTEVHNYFPVAHQRNVYEGLLAAGEDEVVTICRSSWAGSQRYGAAPAAHDIMSTFEHLDAYMKAGLNLAMSGIPWGASEIGGFVTLEPESDYFHELIVRWYQYGVFTPVFRTHGARKNNEPWTIGGDTYRHIRAAILLRDRLRPYVMAQMAHASKTGVPPMRPLCFDHDHDPDAAAVEDQFMFGPDLLIAPITQYEVRERSVHLPAGAGWIDAWSGALLDGGERVQVDAPLERIPVFVRAGADAGVLAAFASS